jgi:hypothetical protein
MASIKKLKNNTARGEGGPVLGSHEHCEGRGRTARLQHEKSIDRASRNNYCNMHRNNYCTCI